MDLETFIRDLMESVPGLSLVSVTDLDANTLLEVHSKSYVNTQEQQNLKDSIVIDKQPVTDGARSTEGSSETIRETGQKDASSQRLNESESKGAYISDTGGGSPTAASCSQSTASARKDDTRLLEALAAAVIVASTHAQKVEQLGDVKSVLSFHKDKILYQVKDNDRLVSMYGDIGILNIALLKSISPLIVDGIKYCLDNQSNSNPTN